MRPRRNGWSLLLLAIAFGPEVHAGIFFHRPEGTPSPGRPRHLEHSDARAGAPRCVGPNAVPTNGPGYSGYHVGGGAACGGCPRRPEDGTWGWDYSGVYLPRRVGLSWSRGRLVQGGTGSYRTDGLRLPGQSPHP